MTQTVPDSNELIWRREVVCGGNPRKALVRALAPSPIRNGEIWSFAIQHDVGCPSLNAGGMAACTCEIVGLEARRAA